MQIAERNKITRREKDWKKSIRRLRRPVGCGIGDRLETIGKFAFNYCDSLRSVKIPSVRSVQDWAFGDCNQLTDVEFGRDLETIGTNSFYCCRRLQRISIPLKGNLFPFDVDDQRYTQFDCCENLTAVNIVGAEGLHKTISSLLLASWRDEMSELIDRINQELPHCSSDEKGNTIRWWIRSVINRLGRYKAEHNSLLKQHMTQLELAVWKAKLEEKKEVNSTLKRRAKRAKIKKSREEKRITSGADIIIKNVLPFLTLG